jgi:hypothetical protein
MDDCVVCDNKYFVALPSKPRKYVLQVTMKTKKKTQKEFLHFKQVIKHNYRNITTC